MNIKGDPSLTVAKAESFGFPVTQEHMTQLANELGEKTLFGRTGGAATLAVGMAQIFSKVVNGRGLDLWYHFAIMFEALFILTTLDAGTRVGRYLLQDSLGHLWKPLGDTRKIGSNVLASMLMVFGWGYFLIQGVKDPLGGINSLWPLFGIANQLLAAIALCLATTIILKMQLGASTAKQSSAVADQSPRSRRGNAALVLVTLAPLAWLLAVTMTAGVQKIASQDPRIGFLTQARALARARGPLEEALSNATAGGSPAAIDTAQTALRTNRVLRFNCLLDASVGMLLLVLTASIVVVSAREWFLLLTRRKSSELRETQPVWLPLEEVSSSGSTRLAGVVPLALALVKELSVEGSLERAQQATVVCECQQGPAAATSRSTELRTKPQLYLEATERRFKGINRCC
jgi:carbon starvation protein